MIMCLLLKKGKILKHGKMDLLKSFSIIFLFFFSYHMYKGPTAKKDHFCTFPCEFTADDLTRLFYLFFSNDGY